MPFLGQDWRASGDTWVRTDHGWETLKNWRVKMHENINYNVFKRLLKQSINQAYDTDPSIDCPPRQLFIHVPKPCSSRIAQSDIMFAQATLALDMAGALKDRKRSNYVYKVMEVLVDEKLTDLSGCVQNQLLSLLEHALASVADAPYHKKDLVLLLERLLASLEESKYSYKHIGCDQLWAKHHSDTERMLKQAHNVDACSELTFDAKNASVMTLPELPVDILRHILSQLSSHDDLINFGKASPDMEELVHDQLLWREMCLCHYSENQIKPYTTLTSCHSQWSNNAWSKDMNWYRIYQKLYKRYGYCKEVYTDMLAWCDSCNLMFWKVAGHPCKMDHSSFTAVSPKEFVEMFHV